MTEEPLPGTLTLDDAFHAAFFFADQYMALERGPGTGLVRAAPAELIARGAGAVATAADVSYGAYTGHGDTTGLALDAVGLTGGGIGFGLSGAAKAGRLARPVADGINAGVDNFSGLLGFGIAARTANELLSGGEAGRTEGGSLPASQAC